MKYIKLDFQIENNIRMKYSKDVFWSPQVLPESKKHLAGKTTDLITLESFKDGIWKEVNFIFTADERDNYKDLIELYNFTNYE